jgi:hypothetical protein
MHLDDCVNKNESRLRDGDMIAQDGAASEVLGRRRKEFRVP